MENFDINRLHEYDEEQLSDILQYLNDEYHNKGKSSISDESYDLIREYVSFTYPTNDILIKIGSPVSKKQSKSKLPIHMGSMNKVKNNAIELDRWKNNNNKGCDVLITDKLDGVSALLVKNGIPKLFTRGDGTYGQDISHILSYLANMENIANSSCVVRGELIINKQNFEHLKQMKIIKHTSNARNIVSGIVNAKKPNMEVLKYVNFVGYEVFENVNQSTFIKNKSPYEQMNKLNKLKIECVDFTKLCKLNLTVDKLRSVLRSRKENSDYEIDGLIITNNIEYDNISHGNPKNSFAFKMNMDEKEVIVTNVVWNLSKDGYLIPTIHFSPIYLQGVEIRKATGFNAKFIHDNKINKNSILTITRSGDVVPHVTSVIKPSEQPQMPEEDYVWNCTGIHIRNENKKDLDLKLFQNLVIQLKFKGISNNISKKLFENGVDTLKKLLSVDKEELIKIDGIKTKAATNIIDSIQYVKSKLTCVNIMVASNTFGRGVGKEIITKIINQFPKFLTTPPSISEIIDIDGIDKLTAYKLVHNIPTFLDFLKDNDLMYLVNKKNDTITHASDQLKNHYFVFTGSKNKVLLDIIPKHGGTIETNISKKTTHVITDYEKESRKISKAKSLGLYIIASDDNMFNNLL